MTTAGHFIESYEVQQLTLCLIAFDVVAAVTTMMLTCSGEPAMGALRTFLNALNVLSGPALFYFILELVALLYIFRAAFFRHIGNLIDRQDCHISPALL